MKNLNLEKYIKAMVALVVIYSLIINLTILLVLVMGGGHNEPEQEVAEVPDRIVINDIPELEIEDEYDVSIEDSLQQIRV